MKPAGWLTADQARAALRARGLDATEVEHVFGHLETHPTPEGTFYDASEIPVATEFYCPGLLPPTEYAHMEHDRRRDDALVLRSELEAHIQSPRVQKLADLSERPLFGGPRQAAMFKES